jgi:hypothetical protein
MTFLRKIEEEQDIKFVFQSRASDSSLVDSIWRTQSEGGGSFTSVAESHWGLVVTRQAGKVWVTVRGPETKAAPALIPENAEFFGIIFKLGTYMQHLPARILVDGETNLPEATSKSFWLHSSAWQFPDFDNADTFIERLVRQGLLVHDWPLYRSPTEPEQAFALIDSPTTR